jgi:hypothetical protein
MLISQIQKRNADSANGAAIAVESATGFVGSDEIDLIGEESPLARSKSLIAFGVASAFWLFVCSGYART